MQAYIEKLVGTTVSPVIAYSAVFLLILIAIYILVRVARALMGGTYVAGGKGRNMRLAVMDATPVDSVRRLVLVRRDDVEHLILIGGPTDVVVEQNIRLAPLRQEPKMPPQEAAQAARQTPPQAVLAPTPITNRPVPAVQIAPAPLVAPREIAKPIGYPVAETKATLAAPTVMAASRISGSSASQTTSAQINSAFPQVLPAQMPRAAPVPIVSPNNELSLESELDSILVDINTNAQKP